MSADPEPPPDVTQGSGAPPSSADIEPEALSPSSSASRPRSLSLVAFWALAWVVTAALVVLVHYGSGDPDSKLYAGLSARMSALPVREWIAPEWWGFWGLTGPYHEHPVGMFVVPAALARAGYPAAQAAYAVNALYQVLAVLLIVLIARSVVPRVWADALGWIVQLLPIAFVFRIRANQEYAVLAGLLFALYACERARTRPPWVSGMLAGFLAVLLVKGVFAFMVPLVCVLWLLARGAVHVEPGADGEPQPHAARLVDPNCRSARQPIAAWTGVLLMPVAGALAAWAYESAYLAVTGRSFLEMYRARQVPEGALTAGSPVVRSAYTLVWYTGRVIWFAFPWSLLAGAAMWGALRAGDVMPPGVGTRRRAPGSGGRPASRQGAWFAAATTVALVVAFSLAHRKADRYIFPAYFSAATLGGTWALARFPRIERMAALVDRPWFAPALHVALVLLRLVTRGALPEFTFWRS